MSVVALQTEQSESTVDAEAAAVTAGARIAPTWPLDQLIAVNPWWEMREHSIEEVAARVTLLGHVSSHMPRAWFREQYPQHITQGHLEAASSEAASPMATDELLVWLDSDDGAPHWRNFSDTVDAGRDLERQVSWHDEIIHQISQFCASYYRSGTLIPTTDGSSLYQAWLESVRSDRGIEIMMGERGLQAAFRALPQTASELLAMATEELEVPGDAIEDYFHALLLDVNGWASWVAYLRWQSMLAGSSDDEMPELLAVRLAWELVLYRHQSKAELDDGKSQSSTLLWKGQFALLPQLLDKHRELQNPAWIWQRAAELKFQGDLHSKLLQPVPEPTTERPPLQAALCIDVRSEVFRRALEAQDSTIQTLGFAGFFGLPIAYADDAAAYTRPQLPGLLSPALTVTERGTDQANALKAEGLNRDARWSALGKKAPASFGYVESVGLGYAFNLLVESLFGKDPEHPVNGHIARDAHFSVGNAEGELGAEALAELAAGILGAMTLTSNFAPVVLLAGHGSSTRNNPHAAGLDCGACGGQTGEVNVRVLAQLLNDEAVRELIGSQHGIDIPADTRFVAALHDTTTDDMHCLTPLPDNAGSVRQWLDAAGAEARRERAGSLNVPLDKSDAQIRERSRDWSQVRPEWGLAGNACFIVAARSRTRHINLAGRSFLHDYDAPADAANGYPVLELIMTAPMIVTHWINMQYNVSVLDNERLGSGNKVLHNVVGGNLGVFEGNGGDLRIGLPMQSLHDGERWMHDTLRLSVYIDAPAEAIADIAQRHEMVTQLIDNNWLYLFRIDDESGEIQRLYKSTWAAVS